MVGVASAPIGIVLLHRGRFAYATPPAASLLGYRVEEMIGRMDLHDILCRQEWERAQDRLRQCERGEQDELQLRVEALRKDGKRFVLELRGRPVTYKDDTAVLCYCRDGTRERELTEQLVEAGEAERRRLGKELHDGIASRLTGISMMLESHIKALERGMDLSAEELRKVQEQVKEGIKQVRCLSHGLNPAGLSGEKLSDMLRELADGLAAGIDGDCFFEEIGEPRGLPEEKTLQLYRIAQEAGANAARHSQASRLNIKLRWDPTDVLLTVEDDGVGFVPEDQAGGIGLTSMRQRARRIGADLTIDPSIGEGTRVQCRLPVAS